MRILSLILTLTIFTFTIQCTPDPEHESALSGKDKEVRFLALGDSYTIGESVEDSLKWPVQLADSLSAAGYQVQTDVIARTGWTTNELKKGIEEARPDSSYDLVSLLIGVNNQYRGYPIEEYIVGFRVLLKQAIAFANNDTSRVFVVSIPNYGVTPFGLENEEQIRAELLEYDDIASRIAAEYGIPFFDITPISEEAKTDSTLIAADQLHPSATMYSRWVSLILPEVEEMLKQ